jgi:eukaryotic-like serine/threonine-protein kinase
VVTWHPASLVAFLVSAALSVPILLDLRAQPPAPASRRSGAPPSRTSRPRAPALAQASLPPTGGPGRAITERIAATPEPAPRTLTPAPPAATIPPPSAEADPYELLEPLGQGQMGAVWRGRHRKLGRIAAIKTMLPGTVDEDDVGRFKREAKLIAGLRSPHVVTLYDFGERADGTLYFAMELLDGIDLQSLVDQHGPMPIGRAHRVLTHVCRGLAEAHEAGVVHRDLKPQNVVLCRKGAELDVAKILDFGLAKQEMGAPVSSPRITRDGLVLGTPAYVAPESLDGSHDVDGRADLYAVGCIGFWLVTGELVFAHDNPIAMVKAHLTTVPRLASKTAKQPIPPTWDALLLHLLAKRPTERPATAGEVVERLEAMHIEREWTNADASAWWAEHRPSQLPPEPAVPTTTPTGTVKTIER